MNMILQRQMLVPVRGSKPLLAEAIIPCLTRERCQSVLDLDEQMKRLCNEIREWNNVGER